MSGYLRTTLLMAGLVAFAGAIGFWVGGMNGLVIALVGAGAMNLYAYWHSDKALLRMYGAKLATPETSPHLYKMIRDLARQADLPIPKIYVIQNEQPNAFATGRNPEHGAVAITTGLMRRLAPPEIEAVMAHELAHIKNRDTLIMTVTATIAGAVSLLANFAMFFGSNHGERPVSPIIIMIVSLLAPIAAMIIQMAISRAREFEADRVGAIICGNPRALASALQKIAGGSKTYANPDAEDNPATAHMFIINPLHMRSVDTLFSTHPDTNERVRRLLALEKVR